MRRCLRWLTLFCVPFLFCQAHAQGRIDCNALESRVLTQTVHYCVMLPPGYDTATAGRSPRRYPVLYFLHGLGDNEQTFFKSGGWDLIEDLRQQVRISDFLIVAPEGRRSLHQLRRWPRALRRFLHPRVHSLHRVPLLYPPGALRTSHQRCLDGRIRCAQVCFCLSGAILVGQRAECCAYRRVAATD